jgi:UDP-glucuronate 4-epimerase
MNKKNILVTGGAGFIGSHLVDALLKDGNTHVTCIDNFDDFYSPGIKHQNIAAHLYDPNFTLIEGDICNTAAFADALLPTYDHIVHLAAKAGVRPSIKDPAAYQTVNVVGLQNMLEIARAKNISSFIFGSSSSVYGINSDYPWTEGSELMPISPYASSKIAGEWLGKSFSLLYGIRFIALRFFTVIGPRQRPDLAINKFTSQILNNEPISFYGKGDTIRDYTYVGDIVAGI